MCSCQFLLLSFSVFLLQMHLILLNNCRWQIDAITARLAPVFSLESTLILTFYFIGSVIICQLLSLSLSHNGVSFIERCVTFFVSGAAQGRWALKRLGFLGNGRCCKALRVNTQSLVRCTYRHTTHACACPHTPTGYLTCQWCCSPHCLFSLCSHHEDCIIQYPEIWETQSGRAGCVEHPC